MSLLHVFTTYLNYYMTTRPRALQPGLQGLLLVITRTRSGKSINVERLEHASIQLAARLRISRRREMLLQLRDFIIIFRVTSPLCVPCEISCRPRPDHDHRFDSRPTSLRVRKPLSSLSRMSKPMLYWHRRRSCRQLGLEGKVDLARDLSGLGRIKSNCLLVSPRSV